jgi:hypothetical protein
MSTMVNRNRYFKDLNALLKTMPAGEIDMGRIAAHEQRSDHRYTDPPEIVERWLLDQQRRLQAI